MTHSKDPKDENLKSSFGNVLQQRGTLIKACIWLSAAICGALVVTVILTANTSSEVAIASEEQTRKARTMHKVKEEFVMGSCKLINLSIGCRNTSDIYLDVFRTLEESSLEDPVLLLIYNQDFPNNTLSNSWLPSNKVIKEVLIANGNFNNIMNEAFNALVFTITHDLRLIGIDIPILSNGALLGLSKLHSLHIVGEVGKVSRCFFQPVQSSLIRLRLSVGLLISGKSNVFGISFLPNLTTLDLSDNTIVGSVSRTFFAAVPNTKFLTLSNSKITSFDEDAFIEIENSLHLLDLSNNQLVSVDVTSFERILVLGEIDIYLLGNDWYCDCDLKALASLYHKYKDRFRDMPYCIGPLPLYGVLLTNVNFEMECISKNDGELTFDTTTFDSLEEESSASETTNEITNLTSEITSGEGNNPFSPFQMRCMSVPVEILGTSEDSSSSSEQTEYFLFEPPCHEFQLNLMKNNSVQVVVEDAHEHINIVWFSDAIENFGYTIGGITVDYNCERYTKPYLIVDDLLANSAYTFCLVPNGTHGITPFNCLPLYIPVSPKSDDVVWISADDKPFTVGIVCLIFISSMFCGGVIAYFGIKAYPDLLEGSSHVLVVKKSDKTCYVSTITDYMDDQAMRADSFSKKSCLNKICLSSTQPSPQDTAPLKSKDIKEQSLGETDDHYELPSAYNHHIHDCQMECIPNKYATSPKYPPPLPKRNSNIVLGS